MSTLCNPHGLLYTRLLCPSPWTNSCPSGQWCYPISSSSAIPFSFCLQSFLASVSFPMSQLFISNSQSTGASAPVLPMSIQGWFKIDWFDLLAVQGTLKSLLQHHSYFQYHLLLSDFKSKWQFTPVFLLGKSHGQRSLVGCSPWGHKESDMTELIHMSSLSWIITNLPVDPSVSTPPVYSQHSSWNIYIKYQSDQCTSSS